MFFNSPKNYNDALAKLNRATFFTTLLFFILLRYFKLIPQVEIPKEIVPPIEGYKELIQWILSFGVIPLCAAGFAFLASHSFELHNKVAWLVRLRPFWSRHFILGHLKKRAQSSVPLTPENAKLIMNQLFYPGIKKIDQHHVHLFWRYATQFWILFEHLTIIFITVIILSALQWGTLVVFLWLYFFVMAVLAALHLFFVSGPRSTKQVDELPAKDVDNFFSTHFPESM